ncbi:N-6 DNA Methylase [Shewanella morhuae]|uniref:Eco57I restriction-modification methylase domain-containing protein n=1 Tax=Shewanella morhuae TaxID=365591 RepID=UPI000955B8CB|nr:N-6 DNA methylase [Shewanella morhuae]SIR15407.1 N-6 DNA Methylase [Shewanella morhuae]
MRSSLDKALRKKLETTVEKAREVVEAAVTDALTRLGISVAQAPSYLSDDERKLRNTLRAHARQLGDKLVGSEQETESLVNEMAYEHWHRMLFARYLEQNNLLMYEGTPVTLDECNELAEEEPDCKDGWELAGRLAQKMLPQIFRADSPVFEIKLSINHINTLENLIAELDLATFQAQDSLGWCYQFWQNKKKKQVNESGVKIGAKELSPVTQLFTEPYMVSFLLDNALGAWWAKRRLSSDDLIRANSEQELRELAAIPGVPLEYLRFVKDEGAYSEDKSADSEDKSANSEQNEGIWKSAAGDFDKWPEHLSELKTLDPCCGSGHFLVAVFLMLVPMRMHLEGLTAKEAVNAVLQDNIHGLELDQRCVELAAFALALEAWRYPGAGGYRALPELQLACSGMSITEAQKEWKNLAKGDEALTDAITWMQHTFKDAPTLGSLINPTKALKEGQIPPWELLQQAMTNKLEASNDAKATAHGLAKAASLLSIKYQYVVTNVPYLARGKQSLVLSNFCVKNHSNSKNDLATVFLEKCLHLCGLEGSASVVLPQNWLFLSGYKQFRKELLSKFSWDILAKLGPKGFQTPMWDFNVQLITISKSKADKNFQLSGVDVSGYASASSKSDSIKGVLVESISQKIQLDNPDFRISFKKLSTQNLLGAYASSIEGLTTGDMPRFIAYFWERVNFDERWAPYMGSVTKEVFFGGREQTILWESGKGELVRFSGAHNFPSEVMNGKKVLGSKGIRVGQMGKLYPTITHGDVFDKNAANLVPDSGTNLAAIWCFTRDSSFAEKVREVDQALKVTNASFLKVEYDETFWSKKANTELPNGLPEAFSDDPTQWIFHGHPCASVIWDVETKTTAVGELRQDDTVLQVAVARLLGYKWPAELDEGMELAPEMRQVMLKNAGFDGLVDDDGIVCIPAIRGEMNAVKRIEAILQKAYGTKWSNSVEANLLKAVKSTSIDDWLRDKFFEQHCKLFQHRPFIWQIWDGLKDGFSALVNYHKLDYKGLERLIYTYLDDWISTQKRGIADNIDGADIRLSAAENLKVQLEAILEGEALPGKPGLDIFVRWKPLAEQPIGWNPDLNDGVRLNIRPFMYAQDMGKKGAGVLRAAPNIHWKKDRGTDVASAPWFHLGPEYGGKEGDRINDHHLTIAEKKAVREKLKEDI